MNDNNNELQSSDSSSAEALSRAERIKAIKNSIRKSEEAPASEAVEAASAETDDIAEAAGTDAEPQTNDNEWENDLAERIARRVQKVKSDKQKASSGLAPEEIIQELDDAAEETENSVSEEETSYEETQEEPVAEEAVNEPEAAEKPVKKSGKKKKKKNKTLKESLLGLFPQKGDSIAERVRKMVFLGSCCAIVVCGYIVADYYIDTLSTQSDYLEIMEDYDDTPDIPEKQEVLVEEGETYTILPQAEKLLEINDEVVGVITIPDTKVNYPVMQSGDLEKYLDTNIMGEKAKAGALFLDYRNRFDHVVEGKLVEPNSDNLIIYGHNMGNGNMFGTLKNYRNNANYYEEHPIIELNSNYACYKYKIFAFFIIDAEDETETVFDCWNYLNFNTEEDFYNYVNEVKKRTIRLTNVDVKYGDQLLTLSTCNSIFGQGGGGRLIVMARRVRDGEDLYEGTTGSTPNPNIKWPTLYYKYNKGEEYDPNAEFIPYNAETTKAAEETEITEE